MDGRPNKHKAPGGFQCSGRTGFLVDTKYCTLLSALEDATQVELDRMALDKIERAIAGIMAAIEDGMYQPAMKVRMEDLERQKTEILTRMA